MKVTMQRRQKADVIFREQIKGDQYGIPESHTREWLYMESSITCTLFSIDSKSSENRTFDEERGSENEKEKNIKKNITRRKKGMFPLTSLGALC